MKPNDYIRIVADLSDELGYPYEAFTSVHSVFEKFTVGDKSSYGTKSVNAEILTRAFIENMINCTGDIKTNLSDLNIKSSEDVGKIIYGLISKNLLQADGNDSLNDFSGIFKSEEINDYIKKEKLKKAKINYDKLFSISYFVGFIIFALAYSNVIPEEYKQYGWLIGLFVWLLYYFYRR